jgi:hypothetical protein
MLMSSIRIERLTTADVERARATSAGITVLFVPADMEDEHALEFYSALGGAPAPVTIFTFSDYQTRTMAYADGYAMAVLLISCA